MKMAPASGPFVTNIVRGNDAASARRRSWRTAPMSGTDDLRVHRVGRFAYRAFADEIGEDANDARRRERRVNRLEAPPNHRGWPVKHLLERRCERGGVACLNERVERRRGDRR